MSFARTGSMALGCFGASRRGGLGNSSVCEWCPCVPERAPCAGRHAAAKTKLGHRPRRGAGSARADLYHSVQAHHRGTARATAAMWRRALLMLAFGELRAAPAGRPAGMHCMSSARAGFRSLSSALGWRSACCGPLPRALDLASANRGSPPRPLPRPQGWRRRSFCRWRTRCRCVVAVGDAVASSFP